MAEKEYVLGRGDWPVYSIYGLTVASDFPFRNRIATGRGPAQITFTCESEPLPSNLRRAAELIHASPFEVESGESNYSLYRVPRGHVLHFAEIGDFYVGSDRIVCYLLDPDVYVYVEILFLGVVLSFVLETRKTPALHAAAVVIGEGAVAFLADNKGGKSSLAATFMQFGNDLLSDDILPVRFDNDTCIADPGYPQMRLWPDQATHFVGRHEHLELVDPVISKRRVPVGTNGMGSFCDQPQSLRCLYLPSRRVAADASADIEDIEIHDMSQGDAIIELVRHTFIPRTVEAMGLQSQRLRRFARILRHVPARRLSYPSGVEHLPRTCQAILDDLDHSE